MDAICCWVVYYILCSIVIGVANAHSVITDYKHECMSLKIGIEGLFERAWKIVSFIESICDVCKADSCYC